MARGKTVGLIGIGRMGNPVAQRFSKAGYTVMGWDIDEKALASFEKLKGAQVARPGEVARACSVILFVVPSTEEIGQCLRSRDGVLANARKGLVIYDLTTSNPLETRKLAALCAKKGVAYLDAGMSGGPAGILAGKLTLMLGGDEKAFRRTKAYLAPFTENLFHLGAVGSGHTMKLLNNMVLHSIYLSTCEAARLAERMGMSVKDMIDIFNVSTAYSYASEHRFPNNILNGSWNAQARIFNPHKDVGLAVKLGKKCKAHIPHAEATYEFLRKAVARGMIEQDYSLLYRDFDAIQKTRPGKGGKKKKG